MFKKFTYPVTILETHLDIFGHVNNAVYLELYEEARWDFITKNGYGIKEIQERQEGPIILEVQCRFLKELKARDKITIETQVTELKRAASVLSQKMINEKGEVCSEAQFKFGLFDMKRRRLIAPSDLWLHAIGVTTV
jgi:YbgC/YbaW family acyl-CoA thioester hydrolase